MERFPLIVFALTLIHLGISVEDPGKLAGKATNFDSSDAASRYLKDEAIQESLNSAATGLSDETCTRDDCSDVDAETLDTSDGGWTALDDNDVARDIIAQLEPYERLCDVERRSAEDLTQAEFLHRYAFNEPVIIKGANDNSKFRRMTTKKQLLKDYGKEGVRLSTANTHSYRKFDTILSTYIDTLMKPQSLRVMGNETLYMFGDNNYTVYAPLFAFYNVPKYSLPDTKPAFSFGVAGTGTGVPFHWHGPGFAEVIYGRKMWFLSPPDREPKFHPDTTSLRWLLNDFDKIEEDGVKPTICTIEPGEVIYFPDRWWHATLNTRTSVFFSTFLGKV